MDSKKRERHDLTVIEGGFCITDSYLACSQCPVQVYDIVSLLVLVVATLALRAVRPGFIYYW